MSESARVAIPRAIRRALVAEARRARPRECCGLLVGAGRRVRFAVRMRNDAGGTTRYRLDAREHIALRRVLRSFTPALDVVGVYHSHPAGPARPSPTDIAEAFYPDWIYLIVGLRPRAQVRAFRLGRGRAATVVISWQ